MEGLDFSQLNHWVNAPIFYIGSTPVTLGGFGSALLVFIGALLVSSLTQRLVSAQMAKRFRLSSSVSYAIGRFLHYCILIFGVMLAAQCVGLNLGSLAVMFGFLGVGIGFGLQNVTSNFIAGLILLLERPVGVGDFVSVDDQVGRVRHISMRSTLIRTLDNVTIIVPNSKFIDHQVTNWSHSDPKIRIHCPVGVAYGSDIPKVKKILLAVADTHPDVLKLPKPDVYFQEFGNSSLNFDLLIWTDHPDRQFQLRSQINYAIDEAFQAADIRIPFPQRDLHLQMTPAIEQLARQNAGAS